MYFLYKQGVYGHGVFWFGDDIEEGKAEADKAANLDTDDYHEWDLYEFTQPKGDAFESDSKHKHIYTGVRSG